MRTQDSMNTWCWIKKKYIQSKSPYFHLTDETRQPVFSVNELHLPNEANDGRVRVRWLGEISRKHMLFQLQSY